MTQSNLNRKLSYSILLLFLLLFVPAYALAQQPKTVPLTNVLQDVKKDRIPDNLGKISSIKGIVISKPVSFSKGTRVFIQDTTAGVSLISRDSTLLAALTPGDLVFARGTVGQYYGREELLVDSLKHLGSAPLPIPRDVLAKNLDGELYSGQLVRLSGQLIVPPNLRTDTLMLQDRSGRIQVYIPSFFLRDLIFADRLLQGGEAVIVGIADQRDTEPPYDSGYRIQLRDPSDITFAPLPPYKTIGATGVFILLSGITGYLIVRRRRAEKRAREIEEYALKLKESQAIYEGLVNSLDGVVWEVNANDFQFTFVSKKCEQILGYTPEQWLREVTWNKLIHPEDFNYVIDFCSKATREKRDHSLEYRVLAKDGKTVWVKDIATLIVKDNEPFKIRGVLIDVTEQKRSEEALQKSENQYRSLVDSAQDIIFSVTPNLIIAGINPAFETITGFNSDEWIGKSLTDLFHAEDLSKALSLFREVLLTQTPLTRQYRLHTKKGDYLDTEFTITPHTQSGTPIGLLAVARDITSRKRIEEQLRQSQKMESIGTLAGGIAHDFNNILGIIIGYTSMLGGQDLDQATLSTSVSAITQAVQRGSNLVRQILTLARKAEVTFVKVNVNNLIDELSKMLADTFPKTMEISLHLDKTIPAIRADSTQLMQSLLNLCVNARDAMPDGGVIRISTESVPGAALQECFHGIEYDEYIHLTVEDTGSGMDEETRCHIFEPFFTTKSRDKGTGLGLSVVFGVVQNHDGFINVQSQKGKGTAFHLYFPAAARSADTGVEYEKEEQELPTGTETILVVEDEKLLLQFLKTILVRQGFKVITAIDGIEAIEVYDQHKTEIALVLSDLGLPKLGGKDALKRMKEVNPTLPTIVASGYLDPNLRTDLAKIGVEEIVQKPYLPKQFLKKIRSLLDACPSYAN